MSSETWLNSSNKHFFSTDKKIAVLQLLFEEVLKEKEGSTVAYNLIRQLGQVFGGLWYATS